MLLSVSLYALLNLVGFSEKPPLKIKQWVSAFGPLRLVNFSMDCVLMSLHLFDIFSAALVVCLGLLCNETWMAQSTQVRNKRKPKKKKTLGRKHLGLPSNNSNKKTLVAQKLHASTDVQPSIPTLIRYLVGSHYQYTRVSNL